ncbi:ArgE/DapE family deacylase [Candidatus Woesearchaeota archaeon]|nr:ArgE/DapE family deacylase [Candidatus Woesearchaeota archaeon]
MDESGILKTLIGFNTTNPPGNECLVVEYVKRLFETYNIKYRIFAKDSKRPNIVGYIGKARPHFLIACHSDVVPAGDGWNTNPFTPVEKNGRIYGRGALDNKGPMASLLSAALVLKRIESSLKGTFLVGVFADEERGSDFGVEYLLESKKILPDFAILPDNAGSMRFISIAEKGILRVELLSYGRASHGSAPEKGINAVYNLLDVLQLVRKKNLKFRQHSLLSSPTINLGTIEGGRVANMVPDFAKAVLDIRFVPGQSVGSIMKEIRECIIRAKHKNKQIRVVAKNSLFMPATEVSSSNFLVKKIQHSVKDVLGFVPAVSGDSGASDAKAFLARSIPAVGYSCGERHMFHVANESIRISELQQFTKVLVEIVKVVLR